MTTKTTKATEVANFCIRCGASVEAPFYMHRDEDDCHCASSSPHEASQCVASTASVGELQDKLALARALLREVYESQPAACIGPFKGGPCNVCLWCRVRQIMGDG